MPKYTLDWRTKLLFWLMSRGPALADADLQKVRSGADSKILSNILFRYVKMTTVEDRSIPGRQSSLPVRMYSPIREANLPAEYDPLSDEGKAYADRLRACGNSVISVCYPGMPHGFISFGWLGGSTKAAFAQIKQTLQPFSVI